MDKESRYFLSAWTLGWIFLDAIKSSGVDVASIGILGYMASLVVSATIYYYAGLAFILTISGINSIINWIFNVTEKFLSRKRKQKQE